MLTRLTGAILRAVLVVLMIIIPSILIPGTSTDTSQTVVFLCLFAAVGSVSYFSRKSQR